MKTEVRGQRSAVGARGSVGECGSSLPLSLVAFDVHRSKPGNEGAHPQGTCFHFSVTGGFWALPIAAQTPGAPLLSTLNSRLSSINVSWPLPSTGWNLQQNTHSVSSVNWGNVTAKVQDDGTTKTPIVNPPTGNRFYRLIK